MPGVIDQFANTQGNGYSPDFDGDYIDGIYTDANLDQPNIDPATEAAGQQPVVRSSDYKNVHYDFQPNSSARIEIRALSDVTAPPLYVFDKFILTNVSRSAEERATVFPTFDADILLSFGQQPKFRSFSGVLLVKAGGGDWLKAFEENYQRRFRAEQLIKHKQIVNLLYGNKLQQGYLMQFHSEEDETISGMARFSFNMYIVKDSFAPTLNGWERRLDTVELINAVGDGSQFSNLA